MRKLFFIVVVFIAVFILNNTVSAQNMEKEVLWSENSGLTYYMSTFYKFDKYIVTTLGSLLDNPDDVSVCLYIAQETNIHPQDIMGVKRAGESWVQILRSIKYCPSKIFVEPGMYEIFGVPAKFRHSYNQLKKWQSNPGHQIELDDDQVRDLVQLRFVVTNFGTPPIDTMRARNSGRTWTNIILNSGR